MCPGGRKGPRRGEAGVAGAGDPGLGTGRTGHDAGVSETRGLGSGELLFPGAGARDRQAQGDQAGRRLLRSREETWAQALDRRDRQ